MPGRLKIFFLKQVSAACALLFILTPPVFPAPGENLPQIEFDPHPVNVLKVSVPKQMASVKEIFQGESQKTVFIIQDIHEVPEAQRNIRRIIGYLQNQYKINLVGVEGAASPLDPHLFRSFPDAGLLKKTFEIYLLRGELAGATAASIFNRTPAVYEGIED